MMVALCVVRWLVCEHCRLLFAATFFKCSVLADFFECSRCGGLVSASPFVVSSAVIKAWRDDLIRLNAELKAVNVLLALAD